MHCEAAQCPHPPRGQWCVFHAPKTVDSFELNAEFERAIEGLLEQENADEDVAEHRWDGFVFPDGVAFTNKTWRKNLGVRGARFEGKVSFVKCEFEGDVDFRGARFRGGARFAYLRVGNDVAGNALFDDTIFAARLTFEKVTVIGILSFANAVFEGEALFARFTIGRTTFNRCVVRREVSFGAGEFGADAQFCRLEIARDAVLLFESIDLGMASFLDTNVESVVFRDVLWEGAHDGRRLRLRDEESVERRARIERLAENYRQLVLNYEKKRDYTTAEDFHVGEMETQRKRQQSPYNMYTLYWLLSRYGTSYHQAFAVLLVLVLLFSVGFLFTGIRHGTNVIAYDLAMELPDVMTTTRDLREAGIFTISIVSLARERFYEPQGWEARLLLNVAVLTLAAQAALVLLAVRRRFKR